MHVVAARHERGQPRDPALHHVVGETVVQSRQPGVVEARGPGRHARCSARTAMTDDASGRVPPW